MTPGEKYCELVNTLYKKTMEKKIEWNFEEGFGTWVRLADRLIVLEDGRNENGEPTEFISIRNRPDEVIDSFSDETLTIYEAPFEDLTNYWRVMQKLRTTATRQAIGADTAIDAILAELNDDVPF